MSQFNDWVCTGQTCARKITLQSDDHSGGLLLCSVCKSVMQIGRSFYQCNECSTQVDAAKMPDGWFRFSYGAHYAGGDGNWTTGHCETMHFCSFKCEENALQSLIPLLQTLSRHATRSQYVVDAI